MASVDTFEEMHDGEGISLRSGRIFRLACCDCGLIHHVIIKSARGGWIGLAMRRAGNRFGDAQPTSKIRGRLYTMLARGNYISKDDRKEITLWLGLKDG